VKSGTTAQVTSSGASMPAPDTTTSGGVYTVYRTIALVPRT
jgi:hypothetical protein